MCARQNTGACLGTPRSGFAFLIGTFCNVLSFVLLCVLLFLAFSRAFTLFVLLLGFAVAGAGGKF